MATTVTAELVYGIRASILKAVYPESFSSEVLRACIFMLQIDNKIIDAAEASEGQKI